MKTEFLKELGLEQDVIDKIMAENGKDIEGYKSEVKALKTERDGLKTELGEVGKQIEEFKNLDVEGIKAAADDWKAKAEKASKERDEQIAALKFDHALEGKLTGTKAKDASILLGLLKKDDLKLMEDGSILGLDEQISKIKEEKGFLFESDEKLPKFVTGGTGGNGGSEADQTTLRAAMGLSTTDKKGE